MERLIEGLSPRHCALSLVGEPIMYPEINRLVDELHRRRISTFLVTNAQFPEKIRMLKPITQVCMLLFYCSLILYHNMLVLWSVFFFYSFLMHSVICKCGCCN